MKKLLISLSALVFILPSAHSQFWKLRRVEFIRGAGITQLYGDIGGFPNKDNMLGIRDFTLKHTRINVNGGLRFRLAENFATRFSLVYGLFHSTDSRGANIKRGVNENTVFLEQTFIWEYYLFKNSGYRNFLSLRSEENLISSLIHSMESCIYTGLGGLAYTVKSSKNTNFLKSYTEVIPVGIGVNVFYSDKMNFGIEFGARFTFSDLIDGYSSMNSHKDMYQVVNFGVVYKIRARNKCVDNS